MGHRERNEHAAPLTPPGRHHHAGPRQRSSRRRLAGRPLRGHPADDPQGPEPSVRAGPAAALPRRGHASVGRCQSGLRGTSPARDGCEAPDRSEGRRADSERLLAAHQHRHDHRAGRHGPALAHGTDGDHEQHQRGQHPAGLLGRRGHRRGRSAAPRRRRHRGRGGGRLHPPVQGRLRDHRHVGDRRGRLSSRLRLPRGEGVTGDRREQPPRDPRRRQPQVRAVGAGAHRSHLGDGPLRHGRHAASAPAPNLRG